MTIYTLFLYVGISALVLLLTLGYGHSKLNKHQRYQPLSWYVQYFLGSLLLISGFVKAVDPMGTGYKMTDYFSFFEGIGFPLMDLFKSFSLEFSIVMIVAELALGFGMVLGIGGGITTWGTFLLMAFFLFLTGFNYYTGYVPTDAKSILAFNFSEFKDSNIRITDCGCFGDFLKLKPVETFVKDIFLTLISMFLLSSKFSMKEVVPKKIGEKIKLRPIVLGVLTLFSTWFCFQNFYFDLPMLDFRPFAEGVNLVEAKKACEQQNLEAVQVIYTLEKDGQEKEIVREDYLANFKEYAGYKLLKDKTKEVIKGEKCDSKVQFFNHGIEMEAGYNLFVVAFDLDKANKENFKKIVALATEAEKQDKVPAYGVFYKATDANGDGNLADDADKFRHETQAAFPLEQFGDDKLLPTVVRSNPALILFKDGKIIKKWHHRQLPKDYAALKAFMK